MNRRQEMIAALASAPADLRRVARRSTAAGERGNWGLADILNHLVHVETAARNRMMQVLREGRPQIRTIRPDESQHDPEKLLEALLADFEAARAETTALLEKLKLGDWQRKATFEDGREASLRTLVQMLIDHDTEHLSQAVVLPSNKKDF